jgi:hypothetical protein
MANKTGFLNWYNAFSTLGLKLAAVVDRQLYLEPREIGRAIRPENS